MPTAPEGVQGISMLSKIRVQTLFLSAIPLVFLILLLGVALRLQTMTGEIATVSERSARILAQIDSAIATLNDGSRAAVAYGRDHRASALTDYQRAGAKLPADLARLQTITAAQPGERVQVANFIREMRLGKVVLDDYLAYLRAGQPAKAKTLGASARTRRVTDDLRAAYMALRNGENALTIATTDAARRRMQTYVWILIGGCAVAVALTILSSALFGLRIVRRLQRLGDNARRLVQGEESAPIGGQDEIADLDRVYQEMMNRIRHDERVVAVLQEALLPQQLPRIPGLRIDTAYVSAASGTQIGGDWYDVFNLTPKEIGISVGDVAGHGLRAAVIMGSARMAIRSAARIDSEPARVLQHANRILTADEDGVVVTAIFGILNLADGTFRYAVAGHPAPIVVYPPEDVRLLEGRGLVLGIEPGVSFQTFETKLEAGSALVLYTDGMVEAERNYLKGTNDLMDAVRREYLGTSGNIAEAIQRRIFVNAPPRDDSALIFVGIAALGASPSQETSRTWFVDASDPAAVRRLRRAVLWHLGERSTPPSDLDAAEIILGELLSNAVRHAPGPIEVTLDYGGHEPTLRVADRGGAFKLEGNALPCDFDESGRGLFIIRAMARDVSLEQTPNGKCVCAVLPVSVGPAAPSR
jgi:serine phosphatase RsbU (regulator of sigma subunit)/anti-sigma regulatory factor (Ser/Thr protein kinase)